MKGEKIILGVDPGTNIMGYALIRTKGQQATLMTYDVMRLSPKEGHTLKLKRIFERCLALVKEYLPDEMAVEAPFFGKNVQSMLKLGRAQGVIMAAAMYRDIPVTEYAPRKIKQSITGNGNASKEQVSAMLSRTLKVELDHRYMDASDALGVALCHHYQSGLPGAAGGKARSWDQFIRKNPDRLG